MHRLCHLGRVVASVGGNWLAPDGFRGAAGVSRRGTGRMPNYLRSKRDCPLRGDAFEACGEGRREGSGTVSRMAPPHRSGVADGGTDGLFHANALGGCPGELDAWRCPRPKDGLHRPGAPGCAVLADPRSATAKGRTVVPPGANRGATPMGQVRSGPVGVGRRTARAEAPPEVGPPRPGGRPAKPRASRVDLRTARSSRWDRGSGRHATVSRRSACEGSVKPGTGRADPQTGLSIRGCPRWSRAGRSDWDRVGVGCVEPVGPGSGRGSIGIGSLGPGAGPVKPGDKPGDPKMSPSSRVPPGSIRWRDARPRAQGRTRGRPGRPEGPVGPRGDPVKPSTQAAGTRLRSRCSAQGGALDPGTSRGEPKMSPSSRGRPGEPVGPRSGRGPTGGGGLLCRGATQGEPGWPEGQSGRVRGL